MQASSEKKHPFLKIVLIIVTAAVVCSIVFNQLQKTLFVKEFKAGFILHDCNFASAYRSEESSNKLFDPNATTIPDSCSENKLEKYASVAKETCTSHACSIQETTTNNIVSQRTDIELSLLRRLAAGEFDGYEGSYWWPNSVYWCTIEHGTPIRWKQGPGSTFFNGKENEHIPGKTSVYKRYITDDEKLEFFRKFGRDMADEEANTYYWDNWRKLYMH